MATTAKLFLRPPNSLPLVFTFFPKPPSSLPKFPLFTFSSLSTTAAAAAVILDPKLPYGPSLRKGMPDSRTVQKKLEGDAGDYPLDEASFTRVFDVAALRVPSKDCFALESRLRGHLLNWPRVRNIARVPGDDVDDELSDLVGERRNGRESGDEDALVSLNRRIYGKAEGDGGELSPVLRREELARSFNSRGFVSFRNLARMTRPKRRKKKRREEEERGEGKRRIGRSEFAVVEVVEDDDDEEEDNVEDLKGLLGEEFKRRKWRGPTRLLLLDERYSTKCVEELPHAIKVSCS